MESFGSRLKHAWDVFFNKDPAQYYRPDGMGYSYRPDRPRLTRGNEQSIVTSVYNRIALDVASINIQHAQLDENDRFISGIPSGLNNCLTLDANIDQTGRAFIQDVVMSMLDEGCVAIIPVDTTLDPLVTGSYDINSMRTGKILEWYPKDIRVRVYNEKTGLKEDITIAKRIAAIVENPLYAVINEPNSTLKRLVSKLNLLDVIDNQSGSGKLDLIIQLPYIIKSQARREQAEQRRVDIETQLSGSKYGIAYTDGTEHITQLNRPVENNLMGQIQFLTSMLYGQLGMTQTILDGTADEKTMLNYYNRSIDPIVLAIVDEMKRKFLTKTARSQRKSITIFRDPFRLVPVNNLADIADKFTRNEIMSSNEIRQIVGMAPSKDPKADELRNKNINAPVEDDSKAPVVKMEGDSRDISNLVHHGIKGMKWGVRKKGPLTEVVENRKAKKSDLEDVTNLLNNLSNQDKKNLALEPKRLLIRKNIREEKHSFVSTIDGKIAGFMRESGRPNGFVLLEELVVDPAHRNKGLASKMLDELHSQHPKTLAKTKANNKEMKQLLEKTGYKPDRPDSKTIINWVRDESNTTSKKRETLALEDLQGEET